LKPSRNMSLRALPPQESERRSLSPQPLRPARYG
jgi:hypothetical protein